VFVTPLFGCIEAFGRIHAAEIAPLVRRIKPAAPSFIPVQTHPQVDHVICCHQRAAE
jgi:hypothetical protein